MIWDLEEKELDRLKRSRVVLSLSGGKDSTACGLLLQRNGVEFTSIFMDTGWEHPALYAYLDEVLRPLFGSVEVLKSKRFPGGMVDAIQRKGIFPSRRIRYCTEELKIKPRDQYLEQFRGQDVVHVVGIRREESDRRSKYPRWDYNDRVGFDLFYPLVDHTFDQVVQMHTEAGVVPNPLYLQGMERVGCFPCIYARKSEVAKLGDLMPTRVEELAALEDELTRRAKAKNPESGPRVFFGPRVGTETGGIREVVQWARTDKGGRQFPLFDDSARDGCMRWGLCDRGVTPEQLRKLGVG